MKMILLVLLTVLCWNSADAVQVTLNVSVQGEGRVIGERIRVRGAVISCGQSGSDCIETVTASTEVVITATAAPGFTFSRWYSPTGGAGECVGTKNPCKLNSIRSQQT
jgi:hypothetical protein